MGALRRRSKAVGKNAASQILAERLADKVGTLRGDDTGYAEVYD